MPDRQRIRVPEWVVPPKVQVAFGRIGEGAQAHAALDLMEQGAEQRQHSLDLQIFRALDAGEAPTYQELLSVFAQKHAHYRIIQDLKRRVAASESAARSLSDLMGEDDAASGF